MSRPRIRIIGSLLAVASLVFVNHMVSAEKPAHAEKHQGAAQGKNDSRDKDRSRPPAAARNDSDDRGHQERHHDDDRRDHHRFSERQRGEIHDYYREEFKHGRCPPGLRKQHNGCVPPGLARKWRIGQPLPREVVYYDLPPAMIVRLGPPPAGARYVRIANDILLIAVGTGMVLDALTDLSVQ